MGFHSSGHVRPYRLAQDVEINIVILFRDSSPILDEGHERLAGLMLHIPGVEERFALQADAVFLQLRKSGPVLEDALGIRALLRRVVRDRVDDRLGPDRRTGVVVHKASHATCVCPYSIYLTV